MIEDYQTGCNRTNEEATERAIEIAIDRNGKKDWNHGSWPTNCKEYQTVYPELPILTPKPNSIVDLYFELNNGPVYAYYNGSESAHLVVVTGVNLYKGIVYTNNHGE